MTDLLEFMTRNAQALQSSQTGRVIYVGPVMLAGLKATAEGRDRRRVKREIRKAYEAMQRKNREGI